jgi:mRNA-degrading endonuclease toxin of MazEF toxin-antitoxin module
MVQFADIPAGGEQAFCRPAVIVSSDEINNLPLDAVIVVPSTSKRREHPRTGNVLFNLVEVQPSKSNGLTVVSYFKCEQVRAIAPSLRIKEKLGYISIQDLRRIEDGLRLVMELIT